MFFGLFRDPPIDTLLSRQLAEARIERIRFAALSEQYAAHVSMLDARIVRIAAELKTIASTKKDSSQ